MKLKQTSKLLSIWVASLCWIGVLFCWGGCCFVLFCFKQHHEILSTTESLCKGKKCTVLLGHKIPRNFKNQEAGTLKIDLFARNFHPRIELLGQQFYCLHSETVLQFLWLLAFALRTHSKLSPGSETPEKHFSTFPWRMIVFIWSLKCISVEKSHVKVE